MTTAVTEARIVPPECRDVILPPYADPSVGAEAAEVKADGSRQSVDVIALRLPKPVPVRQKPDSCGLGLVVSGSPDVAGPAEELDAPNIAGMTTTGAKLVPEQRNPVYIFTAALDDRTSIIVMGSADARLKPDQLMSGLLLKATAAVRGK